MIEHRLVTTLGTTWAIVPEVYGIFTDLYGSDRKLTTAHPEEIWIISTLSAWQKAEADLQQWASLAGTKLSPFLHPDNDLASQQNVKKMRELIFRVVLKASESCRELSCSLAGGRKTMSADMQEAARTFGCKRLLHVLSNGDPKNWPDRLQTPSPEFFCTPLPQQAKPFIMPVEIEGSAREDLLDVHWNRLPPIAAERFPIDDLSTQSLSDEITERRNDAGLLSNFIAAIEADERHENWRSLYRLPPRLIEELRSTQLNPSHRRLLEVLPKAELHCHIGGVLNIKQQRVVADAIWESLSSNEQAEAEKRISAIDWNTCDPSWYKILEKPAANRAANVAAAFKHFSDEQIDAILYPETTSRVALTSTHPLGFKAYELPGELSGSAVLGHPAAIEPTVSGIIDYCCNTGINYLELRGSPQKYNAKSPVEWLRAFYTAIERQTTQRSPIIRFIWISDRRKPKDLPGLVKAAAEARQEFPEFLVGLDLAGDESIGEPEAQPSEIAPFFTPVFEACLPITIHAGEGKTAQNIWEAAYHLHADRIGHGLTLNDHPDLLKRFIDRKICLELCPTSNREVVGYHDPKYPNSHNLPIYPLRQLWQAGLPLTLCTDNPGISRTTLADEYLAAARMIGELSLWDCLAMIKQAYQNAFASSSTREKLLKESDQQIYKVLLSHLKNSTF